jgi:hypothetical protein
MPFPILQKRHNVVYVMAIPDLKFRDALYAHFELSNGFYKRVSYESLCEVQGFDKVAHNFDCLEPDLDILLFVDF